MGTLSLSPLSRKQFAIALEEYMAKGVTVVLGEAIIYKQPYRRQGRLILTFYTLFVNKNKYLVTDGAGLNLHDKWALSWRFPVFP